MHLTVFLLCMMAFDRYIKIGYNSFVIKTSKKKYMAIAAFLWLLSFAFAIPNISLFEYNKNRQSCNVDWSSGSLESRIEDSLAALKLTESDLSQLEDTLKRNCSTMEMEECDFSDSVKLEKESVCPTYSLKFKTYVIFTFSTGKISKKWGSMGSRGRLAPHLQAVGKAAGFSQPINGHRFSPQPITGEQLAASLSSWNPQPTILCPPQILSNILFRFSFAWINHVPELPETVAISRKRSHKSARPFFGLIKL
jgi:hypothetical protein